MVYLVLSLHTYCSLGRVDLVSTLAELIHKIEESLSRQQMVMTETKSYRVFLHCSSMDYLHLLKRVILEKKSDRLRVEYTLEIHHDLMRLDVRSNRAIRLEEAYSHLENFVKELSL